MRQAALEGLRKELDTFVPRVQQVMRQANGFEDTHQLFGNMDVAAEDIIRKGKASKPTEFGKLGWCTVILCRQDF